MSFLSFLKNQWARVFICLIIASILTIVGISNNQYWDDEANTALIGRNFIKTGTLSAYDGLNIASYGMKGSINEDLLKTTAPPLQYIIAGLSLALFGDSTGGGRFLFLLIGLLAIPLTAFWMKNEFGTEDFWISALILCLTVAFLLYIRQVRYYPLGITFSIGAIAMWSKTGTSKRWWIWAVLTVTFFILLVLSQYLYAVATAAIISLSMFREMHRVRHLRIFYFILAICGLLALVFLYFYSPATFSHAFSITTPEGNRFIRFLIVGAISLRDVVQFEFIPVGIFIFAGIPALLKKEKARRSLIEIGWLLGYIVIAVLAISFFSPQPNATTGRLIDVRYYTLIIPIAAMLSAKVFSALKSLDKRRILAGSFIVILLTSNILTTNPLTSYGFHSRILQYVNEQLNDYTTGSEAVTEYLEANVNHDECVFIVPMYMNLIQMFYRPEQKFCGLVSATTKFAKKHSAIFRSDIFYENVVPDYFIVGKREPPKFKQLLDSMYGQDSFAHVDTLPKHWKNATRPEILWRSFTEMEVTEPKQKIHIFKKTGPSHLPVLPSDKVDKLLRY